MAYRMGEFGRTIRALTGPNRRMIDRNMLVTSPLQMHAHTGSHKDDRKCAHVTSQEPPRRYQRIPHPTPPHTRPVAANTATIHAHGELWPSLTLQLQMCSTGGHAQCHAHSHHAVMSTLPCTILQPFSSLKARGHFDASGSFQLHNQPA